MKVLIINTSDSSGGAAVAARRLWHTLNLHGKDLQADMLVQKSSKPTTGIYQYSQGKWAQRLAFLRFVGERLYFLPHEKSKKIRFAFSPANTGVEIVKHPLVQEADIIHLHWINGGFISLHGLAGLFALGKPIIWTLHDMWPFTGGCHYSGNCDGYARHCGNCPLLRNSAPDDLSHKIYAAKHSEYRTDSLHVVGCSQWMASVARRSSLFEGSRSFQSIPNPIDQEVFKPLDKQVAKTKLGIDSDKRHLLFGAMNIHDDRKGFAYLRQALEYLHGNERLRDIELIVFGKADESTLASLPFPVKYVGQITDIRKMVTAYSAADVMVTPSLQDNLPNTIMESLACGTPVVAFKVGGVPEMINHLQTGYLAETASARSLADGILQTFELSGQGNMTEVCQKFTSDNYAVDKVALQYQDVYRRALGQ